MNNTINSLSPNVQAELRNWRYRFDNLLIDRLSVRWNDVHPLWKERLLYSLQRGGKRVRALFVYAVGKAYQADQTLLDPIAQAIEMIHTYSLIHDDLPAMDDDDFRRGHPSAHKAYNEADAILMGDALLADAFHLLSSAKNLPPLQRLQLLEGLSLMSGPKALVYGQWMDLYQNVSSFENLCDLHNRKTGALFSFALSSVAILLQKPRDIGILSQIGYNLGLAFQIQDDLLDLLPMSYTGKTSGKDVQNGKKTALTFLGASQAQSMIEDLYDNSIAALEAIFPRGDMAQLLTLIHLLRNRLA